MSEPQFVRAQSIDHAIEALAAADGEGLVIAGGVVVSSLFNQRLASPAVLVDISRIKDLRYIRRTENGLSIGALTTHDDIHRSADIRSVAPLLTEIAAEVSCPRLRNRGTLGGSLCTIGGQGDPATGLIALGATLVIKGRSGERTAKLEDFYKDAFEVDLAPDEILERVDVPSPLPGSRHAFCKIGPRNAMDFTQITASVVMPATGGAIRIGMNGVANTPNRPRATEQLIGASEPGAIDWERVGKTLNDEIAPQGDLVYSENFKRHLALVTLRRAVEHAVGRATGSGGRA